MSKTAPKNQRPADGPRTREKNEAQRAGVGKGQELKRDQRCVPKRNGTRRGQHHSGVNKVFVSEASFKVCHLAMEIWGGVGYVRDAPIEKCLRDAASFFHSDGTNQMQRLKAVKLF